MLHSHIYIILPASLVLTDAEKKTYHLPGHLCPGLNNPIPVYCCYCIHSVDAILPEMEKCGIRSDGFLGEIHIPNHGKTTQDQRER